MPLSRYLLFSKLQSFSDSESDLFLKYPDNIYDAAMSFSNALGVYVSGMIPISSTVELAKNSFVFIMSQANAPGSFQVLFPQALTAFANTLIPGMLPAFIGVAPSSPIILNDIYQLGMNGGTARQVNILTTARIHTWFSTGTYFLSSPSGPVFVGNWV